MPARSPPIWKAPSRLNPASTRIETHKVNALHLRLHLLPDLIQHQQGLKPTRSKRLKTNRFLPDLIQHQQGLKHIERFTRPTTACLPDLIQHQQGLKRTKVFPYGSIFRLPDLIQHQQGLKLSAWIHSRSNSATSRLNPASTRIETICRYGIIQWEADFQT